MSIIESKTQEELEKEFEKLDQQIVDQERDYNRRKWASWMVSGAMHVTILLIMATIIYTNMKPQEIDPPPIGVVYIEPQNPKNYNPTDTIIDPINPVIHDQEVTSDNTVIADIDIVVPEITSEIEDSIDKDSKGREDAVSISETGGNLAFMNIGAGGGSGGMFGKRDGKGSDKRLMGRVFGPHTKGVITSLDSALRWLKKHQSDNGMWSAQNYFNACKDEGPKCEPGSGSEGSSDEAMTGYAILCFLGAGYDHKTPNKYRSVVKSGLDWLVAVQKVDGLIGSRNYEHPIAAQALVEAYAMTNDTDLKIPAQKAVDIILARQSIDPNAIDKAYASLGWDYIDPNPNRNDSSITGWNIMALKSAKAAGLNVRNSLEGSKKWLEGAWKASNQNWDKLTDPYKDVSSFPYTWNACDGKTDKDHLSFIGALCAVFLGHRDGDPMLSSLLNDMDKRWLDTGKFKENAYCIYYSSLAAFQSGGHWIKWRDAYIPYLLQTQWSESDGACKSGTWNYMTQDFHGSETSRVLIHCYYTLSLSVAIRYDLVNAPINK